MSVEDQVRLLFLYSLTLLFLLQTLLLCSCAIQLFGRLPRVVDLELKYIQFGLSLMIDTSGLLSPKLGSVCLIFFVSEEICPRNSQHSIDLQNFSIYFWCHKRGHLFLTIKNNRYISVDYNIIFSSLLSLSIKPTTWLAIGILVL